MNNNDFIERSILFQTEGINKNGLEISRETVTFAQKACSGSAIMWDVGANTPKGEAANFPTKEWFNNPTKPSETIRNILNYNPKYDFLVDMQDRRVQNLVMGDGRYFPVYSFNMVEGAVGRILWPLPFYHDIGSNNFIGDIDPQNILWKNKISKVVWRGITGGRANPHGNVFREGKRLIPLMRKYNNREISKRRTDNLLNTFPRHRFIKRFFDNPQFDVGFVDGNRIILRNNPFLRNLEKPRQSREYFQQYKYIAVLRGLDVGSSFYWTMKSGSLGLVMETPFQTFASSHFEPWKHYVPFKEDLSDLEEHLEWCECHDTECQTMVERAVEMSMYLEREDLRDKIQQEVVSLVERNLSN